VNRLKEGKLTQATISDGIQKKVATQSRGDMVEWLQIEDMATDDANGQCNHLQQVLRQVEALRQVLQPSIDADSCGFMLACYPGKGSRYVKHRDAHPERPGRKLTVLVSVQ
jgi:hypothetical protein